MGINWYPGHMAKARKGIIESLKLIDLIIEIIDARIPVSSRNPDIDDISRDRARIVVLNKADLASEEWNGKWLKEFRERGICAVLCNSQTGAGIRKAIETGRRIAESGLRNKGKKARAGKIIRAVVAGIPNAGKSAFINRAAGRAAAATGDRPGITRERRWINTASGVQLMDTPGILWPKQDEDAALKLAFTGAIKDEIIDIVEVASSLIGFLKEKHAHELGGRYRIECIHDKGNFEILDEICLKRGFVLRGGEKDIFRASTVLLNEFRAGRFGGITLEYPGECEGC